MGETLIKLRNKTGRFFYQTIFKRIFFAIDPEKVHDMMLKFGRLLGSNPLSRKFNSALFNYKNKKLEQTILGIEFMNPVGLAAGFDKNAEIMQVIKETGFGFEEIGSVTAKPCKGNAKPRLWRLKKSKGLVVYYGLKNDGAEVIAQRLVKNKSKIPIGVSIAKTNCRETANEDEGIKDYCESVKILKNHGDYLTINISCPNAYGGLPFTDEQSLNKLLGEIRKIEINKPLFLKMATDLSNDEIDAIIELSRKYKIAGFICTNLTKDRKNKDIESKIIDKNIPELGGISGLPIKELSNKLIKYIYEKTGNEFIIIGCGGIFSAEDAYEKIKNGASLVQLITGMIFEGPQLISEINQGLVGLLKKDGYSSISEAIGKNTAFTK